MYLRSLPPILFLSNSATCAPVAVVYDGGGVYFGGASSKGEETASISSVTAFACIVAASFACRSLSDGR